MDRDELMPMNHELFCSIYADTDRPRDTMALLAAELTGGVVARRGVDCSWARTTFDDDYVTSRYVKGIPTISWAGRCFSRSCHPIRPSAVRSWPP